MAVKADYTALLSKSLIKSNWQGVFERAAAYCINNRARYETVSARMGGRIPWEFIAALHWREANGNFSGVLHNGDKIIGTGRKTYRVPKGRGPFITWEASAVDALKIKGLDKVTDWSLEHLCYQAERFNGFGYRMYHPNIKSPYCWSGTTNYVRGKYVEDGKFSASTVDAQIGAIPLVLLIRSKAPEIITTEKSEKINLLGKIKTGLKALGGTITGLFTADQLGYLQGIYGQLVGVFDGKTVLVLLAGGTVAWILTRTLEKMIIADVEVGDATPSGVADGNSGPLNGDDDVRDNQPSQPV